MHDGIDTHDDPDGETDGPGTVHADAAALVSRRQVLRSVAGAGLAGGLVGSTTEWAVAADRTRLGDFEDGLDGWTAADGTEIGRVHRDDDPAPVTHGEHALAIDADLATPSVVANRTTVREADFESDPYLLAEVLPGAIEGVGAPVAFRFRYRHGASDEVEKSPVTVVDQRLGARVAWDMSGLSREKLADPRALELVWYPGDLTGDLLSLVLDSPARAYVDDVRLTDDRTAVTNAHWIGKLRELQRRHGPRVDDVVESNSEAVRTGAFAYSDGVEVPYRVETRTGGDVEIEIDGDRFRFEGALS